MHRFFLTIFVFLSIFSSGSAQEKTRFVLYATLLEGSPVQLADGSKWQMDKGDTFPVVMFKEQRTRVILQLAGTSFIVPASLVQVIEEKDVTEAHLASYRNNVNTYLNSQAAKLKGDLFK